MRFRTFSVTLCSPHARHTIQRHAFVMPMPFVFVIICFTLALEAISGDTSWAFDSVLAESAVSSLVEYSGKQAHKKFVSHSSVRLVLVAGLEGTGHHAWNAMFEMCLNASRCEVANELTSTIMHFDPMGPTVHGLFGAQDAAVNSQQFGKVLHEMRILANSTGDHLYLMGLCFVHRSAMLSYPNYNGLHKALDHPDITILAAAAEMVGLDFRVILLQRNAQEVLRSTTSRDIGGELEPKILIDNAAVLYTQLQLLHPSFYHCIQYRELGALTLQQRKALGEFLHPTLVAPILDHMLSAVHYSGNTHPPSATATGGNRSGDQSSTQSPNSNQRLENRLKRHTERVAREELSQSPAQLAVAAASLRYHEVLLAQRLNLIDGLCAAQHSGSLNGNY